MIDIYLPRSLADHGIMHHHQALLVHCASRRPHAGAVEEQLYHQVIN
jgi:hypothetical protein